MQWLILSYERLLPRQIRMSEDRPMLCLTGGLCECSYISEALTKELGMEVKTDPQSRYAGAIGAALGAVKKGKKN